MQLIRIQQIARRRQWSALAICLTHLLYQLAISQSYACVSFRRFHSNSNSSLCTYQIQVSHMVNWIISLYIYMYIPYFSFLFWWIVICCPTGLTFLLKFLKVHGSSILLYWCCCCHVMFFHQYQESPNFHFPYISFYVSMWWEKNQQTSRL